MREHVTPLGDLNQKQRVRFGFDDGTSLDARVSQFDYSPDERLQLELTCDGDGDRYQARSRCEDGEWQPVDVRRYDRRDGTWTSLGEVTEVTPLGGSRRSEPDDDTGPTG